MQPLQPVLPPPPPSHMRTPMFGCDTGPPDPCNLIINYIPTPMTDEELRQSFAQFGPLISARVICDRETRHPKGYGFVKFEKPDDAAKAVEAMNGFQVYGKRLKVTLARGYQSADIDRFVEKSQQRALQQQVLAASQGQTLAVFSPAAQPVAGLTIPAARAGPGQPRVPVPVGLQPPPPPYGVPPGLAPMPGMPGLPGFAPHPAMMPPAGYAPSAGLPSFAPSTGASFMPGYPAGASLSGSSGMPSWSSMSDRSNPNYLPR